VAAIAVYVTACVLASDGCAVVAESVIVMRVTACVIASGFYLVAFIFRGHHACVAALVVASDCCVVVALYGVIDGCVTDGFVASEYRRVVARVVLSRDGGGGELPAIVSALLKLVCSASTLCTRRMRSGGV
jgi:hypothetical protein